MRRSSVGAGLPEALPPDVRRAAAQEAREVLMGALLDTPALWVDPPAVAARAKQKALQLKLARDAGLEVPRTLETNDPDAARAFAASCPGGVIAKMYNDLRIAGGTVYTNLLGPADLAALDQLVACPMVFQEAVPKAMELRVVVVGQQVFAAELDTQAIAGAEVDWRRQGAASVADWKPHRLPGPVARGFLALHDALHTNYGSADVILTPDGRYVLLENNVVGESFWLYEMHPIPDALADLLTGQAPARVPPADMR
ncbi:MAG: MvdD family ATP-grasp ribosomal peptide maturase [Alphaproteobacteria bacterium]|nr:MvdD family ATP-grasp ribosomal peptide maturase [Alphaproteobacteria bacterium]